MRLLDPKGPLRLRDRLKLRMIRLIAGYEPGPVLAGNYRREQFGKPFFACLNECLLQARHWSRGETELFATFVSARGGCQFCTAAHTAVAVRHLPAEVVEAALADPRTAPLDPKVQATLVLLEKLTVAPAEVRPDDIAEVVGAGVSHGALAEAVYVQGVFSVINRIADGLDFPRPLPGPYRRAARILDRLGYLL